MQLDGFTDYSAMLRSGIYALLWQGTVVYIGQSKALGPRIMAHRSTAKGKGMPKWHPIKRILFDSVQLMPCPVEELDERERLAINRYRPRYNVHHKPPSSVPMLAPIDLDFDGVSFILNRQPEVIGLVRRV